MNLKLRQMRQQADLIFDLWHEFGRIIDGDRYFEVLEICDRILLSLLRLETWKCFLPRPAFVNLIESINTVRFSSKYVGQRSLTKKKAS